MSIEVIVTRYKEHLDWFRYIIDKVDTIYIYNKGPNDNFFMDFFPDKSVYDKKIKVINAPNVGRIDHTLVYHILNNWETLPETLISLPGSVMMCKKKGYYLSAIIKKIGIIASRYSGFYAPRFFRVGPSFNYTIDDYHAEANCNRNDNPFIKSEYPDFQAWKTALVDKRPMHYLAIRGMFAVSRANITHIDKKIYTNLLDSLSVGDNIENGHFAERIWAHLFRQYSFDNKAAKAAEVTVQQSDTPQTE